FHAWTRQWPFAVPDLGNPPLHANAHQLGQETEEMMLEFTCEALKRAFGARPSSYRGGRWSLNGESIRTLVNCGINVDSTVTPGISWDDPVHPLVSGPDFRDFARVPTFFSQGSLVSKSHGEVLELPVGVSFLPDRRRALSSRADHRVLRR